MKNVIKLGDYERGGFSGAYWWIFCGRESTFMIVGFMFSERLQRCRACDDQGMDDSDMKAREGKGLQSTHESHARERGVMMLHEKVFLIPLICNGLSCTSTRAMRLGT